MSDYSDQRPARTPEEQALRTAARRERKYQHREEYRYLKDRVDFLESEVERLKEKCGETDDED